MFVLNTIGRMRKLPRVGIDIVDIRSLQQKIKRRGDIFLNRIFTHRELKDANGNIESLAAKIAAKEAYIKTLERNEYGLKDIEVLKQEKKPVLVLGKKTISTISLSHTTNIAIAVVIIFR